MGVEKNRVLCRWPYVELSTYESVRQESFYCIAFSNHNTGRKLNKQIKTRSQWVQQHQGRETRPEEQRKSCFRPGFPNKVPEKSQTTEDFTVFRPSQIQQTRQPGTDLKNRKRFYFSHASQILAIVGDHSRHIIKETQCFFVRDVEDGWFIVFARFQSSTLPHTNQNGVMDGLFDLPEISAKSGTIGKQVNLRSPGIFATYKGFFT